MSTITITTDLAQATLGVLGQLPHNQIRGLMGKWEEELQGQRAAKEEPKDGASGDGKTADS